MIDAYIIIYLMFVYLYIFICTRNYYKTLSGWKWDYLWEIVLGIFLLPIALWLAVIRTPELFENLFKKKNKFSTYYWDYEWWDSVIIISWTYKDKKWIVVWEYNNDIKVVIEWDSTTSYLDSSIIEPCFNWELAEELALLKQADKISNNAKILRAKANAMKRKKIINYLK